MSTQAPRVITGRRILVGDDVARRVRKIYIRVGRRDRTADLLGIGHATFDEALNGGLMESRTRDRLLVALEREEAKLLVREAS